MMSESMVKGGKYPKKLMRPSETTTTKNRGFGNVRKKSLTWVVMLKALKARMAPRKPSSLFFLLLKMAWLSPEGMNEDDDV